MQNTKKKMLIQIAKLGQRECINKVKDTQPIEDYKILLRVLFRTFFSSSTTIRYFLKRRNRSNAVE